MADKKKETKMDDKYLNKVLGETYEDGKPSEADKWRLKLQNRSDMIKYLQGSERYWTLDNDDWCGSEKRKTKA